MTPAARLQAAADIVDRIVAGQPAEKALTNWARASRFAGSKDRRAVRDHVFDILRNWRSTASSGGGESGRARVLGWVRMSGQDPDGVFSGQGHAPAVLTEAERSSGHVAEGFAAWDLPDWLGQAFEDGLGAQAATTAETLRHRAPVFLRVNALKSTLPDAQGALRPEGIETAPVDLSPLALVVTEGAPKLARSAPYQDGRIELQDAASQAVVDMLPLAPDMRVLDYCAGGGGKTLAMAACIGGGPVVAHDANPRRMADLPERAKRAGADVRLSEAPTGPFDLVFCDAPCSGSGAWRRAPEGKWRLQPSDLDDLVRIQAGILDQAASLVDASGVLAYATCSVLPVENRAQVGAFLERTAGWQLTDDRQFLPGDSGDGFYVATLRRV